MGFRRQWLLALCLFHCLALAEYIHKGCYDTHGLNLRSRGQQHWQSLSNCQQHCGGRPLVAMRNGGECLCGDSLDSLSSDLLTPGLCNVKCSGWAYQSCGGNSSVDVYVDTSRSFHMHSSASISQVILTDTFTSGSSSQSSKINSASSTDTYSSYGKDHYSIGSSLASDSLVRSNSAPTGSDSSYRSIPSTSGRSHSSAFATSYYHLSNSIPSLVEASISNPTMTPSSQPVKPPPPSISDSRFTSASYVTKVIPTLITKNSEGQTSYVTTTALQLPSPYANANDKFASPKSGNLSGGAIAGIVVGVVLGAVIIVACAGCYLWRRHVVNQEPDLEETKHYQPYSFGDPDAMSVDSPSRNGSSWRKGSSATRSSSYGSVPTAFLSDSVSKGSLNSLLMTEDVGMDHVRQNMPSTVIEEPPSIYNGSQRFSTGSLPDMFQERNLRVANPDAENNRYSQRKFDDIKHDDNDENLYSAGSSGGSYSGQELKY